MTITTSLGSYFIRVMKPAESELPKPLPDVYAQAEYGTATRLRLPSPSNDSPASIMYGSCRSKLCRSCETASSQAESIL